MVDCKNNVTVKNSQINMKTRTSTINNKVKCNKNQETQYKSVTHTTKTKLEDKLIEIKVENHNVIVG